MSFDDADRFLCLLPLAREEAVVRKELMVSGKEPDSAVCVQHPVSPAFRIAEFRLERPSVIANVDQPGGIVLSARKLHYDADAKKPFLLPFHELRYLHRRTTLRIYGNAPRSVTYPLPACPSLLRYRRPRP